MAAGAQAQQQGLALLRAGLRRVLRVNREKLPPPMKRMGDAYARQVGVVLAIASNRPLSSASMRIVTTACPNAFQMFQDAHACSSTCRTCLESCTRLHAMPSLVLLLRL